MKLTAPALMFCLGVTCFPVCTAQAQGTSPPSDYSALTAHSTALSPADKARAQQLFATGFSLWQSGDFGAAELAFKQGLDIDPANATANYYYGDCLVRRKDKAEAKDYLARAAVLGKGSAEAFKAEAELKALSVLTSNIADMTPDELKAVLVGTWSVAGPFNGKLTILDVTGNQLKVSGKYSSFPAWTFDAGTIDGDHVSLSLHSLAGHWTFDGKLSSSHRMNMIHAQAGLPVVLEKQGL